MKKTQRVSVIMPVYNTEKYVWEAIESILNQTFTDFEFIIIDDGSSDKSRDIIQKYAKKDKRIIALQNKKNRWISFTRTRLIKLTSTNYIASQDSDDISEKHRLEICYNFLEKNEDFALVSWDNMIINESWEILWYRFYEKNIDKIILKKSPISQPASMFKKDVFVELWWYDEKLNFAEDYDLWLKIYANWYKIHNIDKFIIKYRIRDWQTKSDKLKQTIKNTIFVQERAIKDYKIKPSISDKVYHFLEKCLLFLPSFIILYLFKKVEYKHVKKH